MFQTQLQSPDTHAFFNSIHFYQWLGSDAFSDICNHTLSGSEVPFSVTLVNQAMRQQRHLIRYFEDWQFEQGDLSRYDIQSDGVSLIYYLLLDMRTQSYHLQPYNHPIRFVYDRLCYHPDRSIIHVYY